MRYLLMIFIFLLTLTSVMALDYSALKEYYSFDDIGVSITGSQLHTLYAQNTTGYQVEGKEGNALNLVNNQSYYGYLDLDEYQNFSINFWVRFPTNSTSNLITFSSNPVYSSSYSYNFFAYPLNTSNSTRDISLTYHSTNTQVYNNLLFPIDNNFHMITIVWNNGNLTWYIDGNYSATITGYTYVGKFTPNMNYMILGSYIPAYLYIHENITYDEMTIWNEVLNQSKITQLYSINMSSENITTGLVPVCIDSHYLCNNPIFFNGEYYCDIGDESYCAETCINFVLDNTTGTTYQSTYNTCEQMYSNTSYYTFSCNRLSLSSFFKGLFYCYNDYDVITTTLTNCSDESINDLYALNPTHEFITNGLCNDGLCTNDCNILGYQDCDSTTSFKICGNYDTDLCLEYSGSFGCVVGEVCRDGYCISNIGTGLTDNSLFTVTPYAISDDNTVYNLDVNARKLTVNTKNLFHNQGFSTNTQATISYTSRTCDYKEASLFNEVTNAELNASHTFSFSPIAQSTKVNINLRPEDDVLTEITIKDSLNDISGNILYILRNSTAKSLCTYSPNVTDLVYCSYSSNSYDDLNSVNVSYNFEFQSKTYTITVLVDRLQSETFSLQPQSFSTGEISQVNIDSNGNYTLKNIEILSYTQPSPFYSTLKSNYDFLPCTYIETGCYKVRTYNNNNGISDFTNHYDYDVCIDSLNNPNPSATSNENEWLSGINLSKSTKYLIVLGTLLLIIGGFTALGYAIKMIQGCFVVGVVISVFVLIMFTVFTWIPVWILIILILIAVATIILVSKLPSNDSG